MALADRCGAFPSPGYPRNPAAAGRPLLVSCGDGHKILEDGAALGGGWELNENDVPGHPLRLMAGFQYLPNGKTVFWNYPGTVISGRNRLYSKSRAPDGGVWSFADPVNFKTINRIPVLDGSGNVTTGEVLRQGLTGMGPRPEPASRVHQMTRARPRTQFWRPVD
jgi:hypothetical protein